MDDYKKVFQVFSNYFTLLKKWADWGINLKIFFEILNNVSKDDLNLFIKGTHKLVNQPTTCMVFSRLINVRPVEKFRVEDFFKFDETVGGIRMHFSNNFKKVIKKVQEENRELFLEKQIDIKKFKFTRSPSDAEINRDIKEKTLISIFAFLPILRALIEAQPNGEIKKEGLNTKGQSNIFYVDLSEINNSYRVGAVQVYFLDGKWYLDIRRFGENQWRQIDQLFDLAA